jgi:PAS domain S-box-containing protein
LQELKTSTQRTTQELTGRTVTIYFEPHFITLAGKWYWDFASDAVFCSNVMMALPQEFEGTKGIIHPDDAEQLREQLALEQIDHLEFRLITSYGEVRAIIGEAIIVVPQKPFPHTLESRLDALAQSSAEKKELEHLSLYKEVRERAGRFNHTGIWWYNESTNETWYSSEVYRIHDVAPFSINAHLNTFLSFIHADDRDVVEEYLHRSYREKTPLHIEYRIQTATAEKYIQYISQWMFSVNGERVLSGMLKDITEEKTREKQLEDLEERNVFIKQQLLFDEDSNALGHWTLNLVTRKFSFSNNFYRLFGLKAKTLIEINSIYEQVHPDDRGAYKSAVKKMLMEHATPEIDFRMYRGDGKLRYMSQKAKLVTEGAELAMIGTVLDITVETLLKKKIKELTDAETVRSFAQAHSEERSGTVGWVWNTTDNSIKWSENFYTLLGLKSAAKEITHKFFLSLVHPEDQKMFRDYLNLLLQQKQDNNFDFRLVQWGKIKYMKASFRLMKHEGDELFIAIFRDVTKEHLLEEALKERVQLAEALSENILDRVLITDVHNTIKVWNKACEETYQMTKDEVIGKNFFDVFPKLKTEEEISLFNRVMKGERVFVKANAAITTRGFFDLHLLPLWDNEHTEINGIIHILHDVTYETELQRNLNERLSFIESLVESSPDHIIALDRNMNYLVWNKKAKEYYGLKRDEVIGKNVLEVFPSLHNTPAYQHFRSVLKGESVQLPAAEGNGHEVYLTPVKNAKGEIHAILWIEHDLSKEMRSEKQFKEQAHLLEAVFNASTVGIILFKALRTNEGRIADYEVMMDNAMTQKGKGSSVEGEYYGEQFPSIKTTGLFDAYNKVMETGELMDMEIFYEGQGFKNWFRITAVRMDDDHLVATAEDITNKKTTEDALNESRSQLEQIAKASPDSITVYDLQKNQPVYLNNCLSEWVGLCNEELLEMGFERRLKLIHPDDRMKLLQFNDRIRGMKDGEILSMEYRVESAEGRIIWLRNRSKPFKRDASGLVTHILSILQNVTEEIELQEQLKQRIQFAQTILDNSTNRITVFDRNYRFIAWNKRCEEIYGVTEDKVIGKTIFEMFPGVENAPAFMDAQERSLKGEYVHVPPLQDGFTGAYLELFYVPLKDEKGEVYAVLNIMHDVSRYVRGAEQMDVLNQQLESKNAELEQKNEEITSFAFVASHDMKEPLRKIHTFSDWLMEEERGRLSEKGKTILEKINASVHRMEILLEDILVLTKINSDPYKEECVDLDKILKQVKEDMAEQIGRTATVIRSGKLPVIKANTHQIFYLFQNLISNAIKFQKPGTVPELTISSEIVKGSELKMNEPKEEYLKLSFADNGFGFEQKYAKKIFQVFQRLHGKHEFEGTGIGLAICKKIMDNHNGMINVISEVGKGSVFNCFFPLH